MKSKSTNNCFMRLEQLFLVVMCLLLGTFATQAQQNKPAQKDETQDDVVNVRTNLVNVDVLVKDKKGKYLEDLKAEDFTVTEDGVPQKIEFFDAPLLKVESGKRSSSVSVEATSTSTSTPGLPRNIISLVLDGQTTDVTNLKRVREGTLRYIRDQISEGDSVAVFAISSGLQLLQPFTQDKSKLNEAVEKAYSVSTSSKNFEQRDYSESIAKLREQANPPGGPIETAAGGSAAAQAMIAARILQQYIKLRTALSIQQTRPILAALAAICDGQRTVPGKKTLVLFSQGFVTPAVLDWQVQSTIDIANRANVAIYIVDSAGLREGGTKSGSLVPASPLAGVSAATSQESRIQAQGGETVFDNTRYEGLNREYDVLYRMSGDTGGKFIKGTNDIGVALERIDSEIRSRYTLSYRSTNPNFDGSFRKLKIEVRTPQAQVVSRSGYYAIPHEDLVLLSPTDKKLLADLTTLAAKPQFPMFVELVPLRAADAYYTVPLTIEIPPDAVTFQAKGDKKLLQLDLVGVVKTSPEKVLSRLGGNFDVALSAPQYQAILADNIFYRQDVDLPAGTYDIDLIVKDRFSGKMSAVQQKLVLPETDSQFAASPVVLSRRAVPENENPSVARAHDVLSQGGARIRPSPARKFHVSDNLIMFQEIYNATTSAETSNPLVRVTVTLMKDNKIAVRPIDYVLTDIDREPVPHLTFAKFVSLKALADGEYTAVIETRDMLTRKVVKQEVAFQVVR